MGTLIELTPEQEQLVLAAYGYADEPDAPDVPDAPDPPKMVIKNETFTQFYGFAFGKPDVDAGKKLPHPALSPANGLATWKMYVGDELALELGVSTYGGGIKICTVQDELAKWPPGKGYEDIIAQIEAMGLEDTDYAVFTQDGPRGVELQGVAWDGRNWKLEMWQQNELRYTMTGPGEIPPEKCQFTLAESGAYHVLHYYWQ